MTDYAIPVTWYNFVTYYPLFTKTTQKTKDGQKVVVKLEDPGNSLDGELDGWVTALANENPAYTTCCIQMSHAINMAFYTADVTKLVGSHSYRRKNHAFTIKDAANRRFNYLASVDEMKAFLDETFAPGVEITSKDDIMDQPGIICFMGNQFAGIHTEVWNGSDFHQGWMKGNFRALTQPKVWFWSMADPKLVDV